MVSEDFLYRDSPTSPKGAFFFTSLTNFMGIPRTMRGYCTLKKVDPAATTSASANRNRHFPLLYFYTGGTPNIPDKGLSFSETSGSTLPLRLGQNRSAQFSVIQIPPPPSPCRSTFLSPPEDIGALLLSSVFGCGPPRHILLALHQECFPSRRV